MSTEKLRVLAGIGLATVAIAALAFIAVSRNDDTAKGALISVLSAAAGYIYRGTVTTPPTDSPRPTTRR